MVAVQALAVAYPKEAIDMVKPRYCLWISSSALSSIVFAEFTLLAFPFMSTCTSIFYFVNIS